MKLQVSCVLILPYLLAVNCVMWNLLPNTRKCLKDQFIQNGTIFGEYEISESPGQTVDYVITNSEGHVLIKGVNISEGKFSLAAENGDMYEICFISHAPSNQRGISQEVSLVTKDEVVLPKKHYYDAKKLKSITNRLKQLEDITNSIIQDLAVIRKREEADEKRVQEVDELTDKRVLHFLIFTAGCFLMLPAWQVLYMRSYFKRNRITP